jgi:hypothetical protein
VGRDVARSRRLITTRRDDGNGAPVITRDVEDFTFKSGRLRMFNMSVLITDPWRL